MAEPKFGPVRVGHLFPGASPKARCAGATRLGKRPAGTQRFNRSTGTLFSARFGAVTGILGLIEIMSVSAINSNTTTTASDPTASAQSRIPIQTLNQQDFLKLLATQMSSQDPMNPQTDTEFIAQMAQFSSLEQTKSMQADIAKLRSDQELGQASALIGKTVTLQVNSDLTAQGTVGSVQIEEGTPKLIVNGQKFDLDQVVTISPDSAGSSTSILNNYARISQLGR
jgi:flagellar basal-body rod modification protein FlgD